MAKRGNAGKTSRLMWGESWRDRFVVDVLRGDENIAKSGDTENLFVLQRSPTWTFLSGQAKLF